MRHDRFRVALRKFAPFESAVARQWELFEQVEQTGLVLEAVPLDHGSLYHATLGNPDCDDWDVVFVNTDWVAYASRGGWLWDLADSIRDNPPQDYPDGWVPSLLRLQNIDGQVLGLPYHDGPECLIYRTDLFERAGECAPETWEEFHRLARLFHRPQDRLYGAVFAAFPDGHNMIYDFCLQLWTRGGELTHGDGRFHLDSPHAVDALAFLREMVNDRAAVHPACREMDSVKSGLAFAAGEAAMTVNWFGFAGMAQTIANSRVKGNVGIAPVPHAPGRNGTSLNIYWILSIPKNAVHRDVAWKFLRHCASPEMDKLLTLEGGIGCRKSTWVDEEVRREIPFYHSMEELHSNVREMPRHEAWPQVAQIIDRMAVAAIDEHVELESIVRRGQYEVERLS
jgi:multiple sugar transport system substrate-binding protein